MPFVRFESVRSLALLSINQSYIRQLFSGRGERVRSITSPRSSLLMTSPSVQVRVGDLKLVELLLFLLPLVLALLLFKCETLVLRLDLLQFGCTLSGHLILEHASHAVKGECLIGVSPISINE